MSDSRAKCRLDRLQDEVDRVLAGDRAFFERHTHRSHRLRLAGRAEIAMLEHVLKAKFQLAPGFALYAVVRQIEPGTRMRHFVPNEVGLDTDVSEVEAAWLFDHLAPAGSQAAEAEASVRGVLARWRAAN